jgi:DNA-binding HxlR family transcriptional regulator
LALASELLTQRWTILVISRVVDGCETFNAIHRGIPRISPSLLSQRLSELEQAGILEKSIAPGKSTPVYSLTEAGRDLSPLIDQMAVWGQRWARDMTTDDLDPGFLAWSVHTRVDTSQLPKGRSVLEFVFTGAPPDCRKFWLLCEDGKVEMCLKHPGFDSDLVIRSDLRLFIETWRGFRDLKSELRAGKIRLEGSTDLRRRLPKVLMMSSLAQYPRERSGRERTLSGSATKK